MAEEERKGLRLSASIMLLIAGCFNLAYGIIGLLAVNANAGRSDYYPSIALGVSGLVGFFSSCFGGFAAWGGKSFSWSIAGAILSFLAELVYLFAYSLLSPLGAIIFGMVIIVPVMVFTLLGLALTISAKNTFLHYARAR